MSRVRCSHLLALGGSVHLSVGGGFSMWRWTGVGGAPGVWLTR